MIGQGLREIGGSFLHKSLMAVVLVAAVLTALTVDRDDLEHKMTEIASYVFTVSGTIVALVLPAAELAGHFIARRLEFWTEKVSHAESEAKLDNLKEAVRFFHDAKARAVPAWRGSLYVFCSFVLATVVLFIPPTFSLTIYLYKFQVGYAILGGAIAFLLVGSASFLPFAFFIYRLDLLRKTHDQFAHLIKLMDPYGDRLLPPDVKQILEVYESESAKASNRREKGKTSSTK